MLIYSVFFRIEEHVEKIVSGWFSYGKTNTMWSVSLLYLLLVFWVSTSELIKTENFFRKECVNNSFASDLDEVLFFTISSFVKFINKILSRNGHLLIFDSSFKLWISTSGKTICFLPRVIVCQNWASLRTGVFSTIAPLSVNFKPPKPPPPTFPSKPSDQTFQLILYYSYWLILLSILKIIWTEMFQFWF